MSIKAFGESRHPPRRMPSESVVRIKMTAEVKYELSWPKIICDKNFRHEDLIRFFQRYEPNCRKMPISECWRIFKKFLNSDPDPEADDFQMLINSFLSTDTSLVKFLWRFDQYYLQANKQTKRKQKNAWQNIICLEVTIYGLLLDVT